MHNQRLNFDDDLPDPNDMDLPPGTVALIALDEELANMLIRRGIESLSIHPQESVPAQESPMPAETKDTIGQYVKETTATTASWTPMLCFATIWIVGTFTACCLVVKSLFF